MAEKIWLLVVLPIVYLCIVLAWIWLISARRSSTRISLHGLGVKIQFASEKEDTNDVVIPSN